LNTEDKKQVHVFVEGDDEGIEEFCDFVKSNHPERAIVDSVKVEDYKGYVPKIEAFALIFNMGQSRKFIEAAQKVENAIKEESEKTREVVIEESQKTRDELGTVIKDESEKTRGELGGAIRDEGGKMREELSGLRSDIKSYMEERFTRIEREIAAIKAAIGLQ
jgi:acylphosphatase